MASRERVMVLAAVLAGLSLRASDILVLSNSCGRAEISVVGAQVLSYVLSGGSDVLFFPDDRDFSRDRQMHGGIPICWPWFGRFGRPGSRMHGLARYCRWDIETIANGQSFSRAALVLVSNAETRKSWPYDFKLRYVVELTDRLALSLVASNACETTFSATLGFHPYFRVGKPSGVTVFGLPEPVSAYPGIDKGYSTAMNGTYRFDVGDGLVTMTAKGERKLVIWNPGGNWADWTKDCNLDLNDWRQFLCVEPAVIGLENAVDLKPGASHLFEMTIRKDAVPRN